MKNTLAILLLVCAPLFSLPAASEREKGSKIPLISKQCIVEGKFSCSEYEYTYSVEGISCTEDCVILSPLGRCHLRNSCTWDEPSGCFRKRVCAEVSSLNTCRDWEAQAICY